MRDQTRWMIEILADPAQTGVVVVTTAEEMPVIETIELVGRLGATVPVEVAAVVVNRVLPELFTRGRAEAGSSPARCGRRAGRQLAEDQGVGATGRGGATSRRCSTPPRWRWRCAASGPSTWPCSRSDCRPGLGTVLVPELFARSHGKRAVMQVAEALAEELELMATVAARSSSCCRPRRSS